MTVLVRSMESGDWADVQRIYRDGISTGHATFETDVPAWSAWNAGHLQVCRLVALGDGAITGWAALSAVSRRPVYAGVAEVSLYVGQAAVRQGVGRSLLRALIDTSDEAGIWTLQGGVFPENVASLRLLAELGFRELGRRERIGQMNGVWRNVILLERRSTRAGL